MLDKLFKVSELFYNLVVIAGRKEEIQQKYPNLDLTELINKDSSGNLKYLDWEARVLFAGKALAPEIADVINLFHKYNQSLEKKDINQYSINEFTDLRDKLFEIKNKKSEIKEKYHVNRESLAEGSKIVYDSDNFTVRLILNKEASCHFGLGTKWCITMKNHSYFEDYESNNVVFFFIFNKHLDEPNPNYKVAVSYQRDKDNNILERKYWDALDDDHDNGAELIGEEISKIEPLMDSIAQAQPKSLVAKVASGEGSEEDYRKFYKIYKQTIVDQDIQDKYLEILLEYVDKVPLDILKELISEEYVARVNISKNTSNPELLDIMAKSKNYTVRENVSKNDNTSSETLFYMLENTSDKDIDVIDNIIKNRNLTKEALEYLSENENYIIRSLVAESPNATAKILEILGEDSDPYVREYVASNKNTPIEVLYKLDNDKSSNVSWTAMEALKRRAQKLASVSPRHWPNEIGAIKKNFDYGPESPWFGTPGGGEKSMGDFIKKRRKKNKKFQKIERLLDVLEEFIK